MIKNFILFLTLYFILFTCYNLYAQYAGGDGSAGNPYQIASPSQLEHLMATSSDWSSHFVLTADIDMTGASSSPIGSESTKFSGSFNGQNHHIINYVINNPGSDYQGLFGYVETSYFLRNLIVSGTVTGNLYTGILCGTFDGGTIENCSSSGSVTANHLRCGGLIGEGWNATFLNCHTSATILGYHNQVGGLGGYITNSTIRGCHSSSIITNSYTHGGGLVGLLSGSTIENCYSTGNVTGYLVIGGFVGEMTQSQIQNCYSTGNVNGLSYIAGFCGRESNSSTIRNCYSTGNAHGSNNIAGFSSYCGGNSEISYCYSVGIPTAYGVNQQPAGFLANIEEPTTIQCNFWGFENANIMDTKNSDIDDSKIKELTPLQMKIQSSFSCGFDFDNIWVMGIFVRGSNNQLPMLRVFSMSILPTLSEWAVITFISLFALIGGWFVWRRIN
mgnify:CR=1 FL=1